MKHILIAAVLMAGTTLVSADEVQIEKKDGPAVNVQTPAPRTEERTKIETTGQGGCDTKTVKKETPTGEDKKTEKHCN